MSQAGMGHGVEVRRLIAASPEEVFDAWTDAAGLSEWMRPGGIERVRAQLDVRVGGAFTIEMIEGDAVYVHRGEYRVVDRPRKLVFTWNTEWIPGGSLVTVEFIARSGGTEVVLLHERLPDAGSAARHESGWAQILDKLSGMLP